MTDTRTHAQALACIRKILAEPSKEGRIAWAVMSTGVTSRDFRESWFYKLVTSRHHRGQSILVDSTMLVRIEDIMRATERGGA